MINPRKVLGAMLFDHLNQSTKQPSHKTVIFFNELRSSFLGIHLDRIGTLLKSISATTDQIKLSMTLSNLLGILNYRALF